MEEVIIANKQAYLNQHYPFYPVPALSHKKYCARCKQVILVGDYKVFTDGKNGKQICCANAPACDGTMLDWMKIS